MNTNNSNDNNNYNNTNDNSSSRSSSSSMNSSDTMVVSCETWVTAQGDHNPTHPQPVQG